MHEKEKGHETQHYLSDKVYSQISNTAFKGKTQMDGSFFNVNMSKEKGLKCNMNLLSVLLLHTEVKRIA